MSTRLTTLLAGGLAGALLVGCVAETKPCAPLTPTLSECTNGFWVEEQTAALPPACSDQLVEQCYDLIGGAQGTEALREAACNDYWKPCFGNPTCDMGSESPGFCWRTVLDLYPTHLRTDGYFQGNQVAMSCEQFFRPGKPQKATPANPLDAYLNELIWSKVNPAWDQLPAGDDFAFDAPQTHVMSGSVPQEPASVNAPGQRTLSSVTLDAGCVGDAPAVQNVAYVPTEWFLDPFQGQTTAIAGLASCTDYAVNKYYDWAVFQARMRHDIAAFLDTPAIVKVRAAFDATPGARGNVGRLFLSSGGATISRSWLKEPFQIGSNPAFPLTAGVSRQTNLVQELLGRTRQKNKLGEPDDALHRLRFESPDVASLVAPCLTPLACIMLATREDWAWHGAQLARYESEGITPHLEKLARLRRQQLLELFARRAQVEEAALLAGKAVVPVARDVLWPPPSDPLAQALWAWGLQQGDIHTTLQALTRSERVFVREQFARDWELLRARVAAMTDDRLALQLTALDQMIEQVVTDAFLPCVLGATAGKPALCEWMPEMFTERFDGLREGDLLDLPAPPAPGAAGSEDLVDAGPNADKHRCDVNTKGLSFGKLAAPYALVCPLNSSVAGKSKFEVCGCTPFVVQGTWTCGPDLTVNSGAETYPVFFPAQSYRAGLGDFEQLFDRIRLMNEVAFAVATAFIPTCSPTPTMTEVHGAQQQFGFDLFGVRLQEDFSWSKDGGESDLSSLRGSVALRADIIGSHPLLLSVAANASRGRTAAASQGGEAWALDVKLPWSGASFGKSGSWEALHDTYYFSVGPIPFSISYGLGGTWTAGAGTSAAGPVTVQASAKAAANLYIEGGVDALIAGAGIGASLRLVDFGPTFTGSLELRHEPWGQGSSAPVLLTSRLDLDTTLLSGRFYAWAKIGACPFCKKFSKTLFDWDGFHQRTGVWDRRFPLPESSLDKLAGWTTPASCQ